MIKEMYCSYEVSKLLKEKGFNESCYGRYSVRSKEFHLDYTKAYNNGSNFMYSAPTHQFAMAWLRDVHGIFIAIEPHTYDYVNNKYANYTFSIWQGDNYDENPLSENFPSYDEAVEAACLYVLNNLI